MLVCYRTLANRSAHAQSAARGLRLSPRPSTRRVTRTRIQTMGKKSRRNRPNSLGPGVKSLGTLTQEQVDSVRGLQKLRITPEKSEEFIKILERHPEHKTGDMSAAWREWQTLRQALGPPSTGPRRARSPRGPPGRRVICACASSWRPRWPTTRAYPQRKRVLTHLLKKQNCQN